MLSPTKHPLRFYGSVGNWGFLFTSDPANVDHILLKNFTNYHKGPEYNDIFDIVRDRILNVDGHLWKFIANLPCHTSFFKHAQFNDMLQDNVMETMEKALIPILDHYLQDKFKRLAFDDICSLLLGHELMMTLEVEEVMLYRHLLPESIWDWMLFDNREELRESVYLHGALCEALRLFPPVPSNHKAPNQPDIDLPSAHRVDKVKYLM